MRPKTIFIELVGCLVLLLSGFPTQGIDAYTLPDTGQTKCYNNTQEIPCPNPGEPFYGQDAQYHGPPLAYRDNANGTVTDLNTGLMWQQGDAQNNEGRLWEDAVSYCESLNLAGYVDWRLPAKRELITIIDYDKSTPAIDTNYFESGSDLYWTSSHTPSEGPWGVSFYYGGLDRKWFQKASVRCARGNSLPESIYEDNSDGTVTNIVAGLTWQKSIDGRPRNWQESLSYCQDLNWGGYGDWRLPNIRELLSTLDDTSPSPYTNPSLEASGPACPFISACYGPCFWSSTTFMPYSPYLSDGLVYGVLYGMGLVSWSAGKGMNYFNEFPENGYMYARCVRGGLPSSQPTLTITLDPADGGSVTGDGIDCPGHNCQATYEAGSLVQLTATPRPGYNFKYWIDGTTQHPENPLNIEMQGSKPLTAKFERSAVTLNVDKTDPVAGMIKSDDGQISCGAVCSQSYEVGKQVTLAVTPTYRSSFIGWSGVGCSGTGLCTITMSADTSVTAEFITINFPVDEITRLISNEQLVPYDPNDKRIPLILVHGIHQTKDNDSILEEYEAVEQYAGWKPFLAYMNTNPSINNNYKVYRFHYLSDLESVQELGRGLRKRLEEAVNSGNMNDTQVVLLAHSMGGLVSRSYMSESGGGDRVKKLIALATPHHGSPGANAGSLDQLLKNADKRDKSFKRSWFGNKNDWSHTWALASTIYNTYLWSWDYVNYNEPNRQDLLWDNYDKVLGGNFDDINVWLEDLNRTSDYDGKIIAYWGYLDPNSTRYKKVVGQIYSYLPYNGPNALLDLAAFGDDHKQLLCTSILMSYGLHSNNTSPYASNDGMVPIQSARFNGHNVEKRVSCPDHDHLNMLGGNQNKKCATGKNLLDSLADDLNVIASQ